MLFLTRTVEFWLHISCRCGFSVCELTRRLTEIERKFVGWWTSPPAPNKRTWNNTWIIPLRVVAIISARRTDQNSITSAWRTDTNSIINQFIWGSMKLAGIRLFSVFFYLIFIRVVWSWRVHVFFLSFFYLIFILIYIFHLLTFF